MSTDVPRRSAADIRAEAAQLRAKAESERKRSANDSWHAFYAATAASYERCAAELDSIAKMIEGIDAVSRKMFGRPVDTSPASTATSNVPKQPGAEPTAPEKYK